jgi:hypothetical protein
LAVHQKEAHAGKRTEEFLDESIRQLAARLLEPPQAWEAHLSESRFSQEDLVCGGNASQTGASSALEFLQCRFWK